MPPPMKSIELVCKNGHPVTKCKKLKPWQGHISDRACNVCGQPIDRKEMRWRCEEKCNWDLCRMCYKRHWSNVLLKISRCEDPALRAEMLRAVPEDRRPADASSLLGAAERGGRPLMSTQPYEEAPEEAAETWREAAAPVLRMLAAWVVMTMVIAKVSNALLGGQTPMFPSPWLLCGIAHVGALAVCKVVVRGTGYDNAEDSEAVDTTSAMVLGLMFGVESGLYAGVFYSLAATWRHEVYMLRPMVMGVASVLAGTEAVAVRPFAGLAGVATVGNVLLAPGAIDWPGLLHTALWMAIAGAVTTFRWVFALNVLPRSGGLPPQWFFAGQVMWPSAAVCFELTVLTDWNAYRQLLHTPHLLAAIGYVAVLAAASALQLVLEFQLVNKTSLSVVGFMMPVLNVVALCIAVCTGSAGISAANVLGGLLYGAAVYGYRTLAQADAAPAGYGRLDAERPTHSAKPPSALSEPPHHHHHHHHPGARSAQDRRHMANPDTSSYMTHTVSHASHASKSSHQSRLSRLAAWARR